MKEDSSAVERAAVSRYVVGSNLTRRVSFKPEVFLSVFHYPSNMGGFSVGYSQCSHGINLGFQIGTTNR